MNSEDAKAEFERSVFTEFAEIAALPVVPGSVQSCPPPEPDILCGIQGRGSVAFELVGLEDEGLTRMVAQAERKGAAPGVCLADQPWRGRE
jgi:hypothetical protein